MGTPEFLSARLGDVAGGSVLCSWLACGLGCAHAPGCWCWFSAGAFCTAASVQSTSRSPSPKASRPHQGTSCLGPGTQAEPEWQAWPATTSRRLSSSHNHTTATPQGDLRRHKRTEAPNGPGALRPRSAGCAHSRAGELQSPGRPRHHPRSEFSGIRRAPFMIKPGHRSHQLRQPRRVIPKDRPGTHLPQIAPGRSRAGLLQS